MLSLIRLRLGVRWPGSDVWDQVSGVRPQVSGVRCQELGARCQGQGQGSEFRIITKIIVHILHCCMIMKDVYEDPRFNKAIDMQTGYRTRSMLCMPVLDSQGNVTAVAQIINKAAGSQFTKDDERNFSQFLTFCGIALTNARLFELSLQEHRQNEVSFISLFDLINCQVKTIFIRIQ